MPSDFRDLNVWKESIAFAKSVYAASKAFPDDERFGISSQLRRAAVSIGCNISEGCGRRTSADFAKFLYIALGSCKECETLVVLAKELNMLDDATFDDLEARLCRIGKMLSGLMRVVERPSATVLRPTSRSVLPTTNRSVLPTTNHKLPTQ